MSPEGSTVTFRRDTAEARPRALTRFARRLQAEVAKGRVFHCLITGDAEMRRLNREFLGKDFATDVLSFPSWQAKAPAPQPSRKVGQALPPANSAPLGDIAISVARARAQARRYGHPTEIEIRILMLHGLLHLLGMDHEAGGGRMARAEKRWRARLRLPEGLIERVAP
jgi:probable rRNA maturation factor